MAKHLSTALASGDTNIGCRNALLCQLPWKALGIRELRLGKNVLLLSSRTPSKASRSVAVCSIGFADILADAISKLPLDGVEESIQSLGSAESNAGLVFAARKGVELLKEYSNLPESDKWSVLGASTAGWIYLTAKPGVLVGAVDAYILAPLQTVVARILGRRDLKRTNFIVGQKLGEGTFGTVYAGALIPREIQVEQELGRRARRVEEYEGYKKFQKVTLKKVKLGVEGAAECGEMEEWFNYRMARAAPDACAEFLGSFVADATRGQFTEGGKWLVWKFEGDSTLADFMKARSFPENLTEPLFGKKLKEQDPLKRKGLIIKKIMRQIIKALKKVHAVGIVHRDVKPSNVVVTNKGKLKLIDFGAATDLRVGKNYVPDRGMLDPDYCPPELLVMPEETPRPPPAPIAAIMSPFLWRLNSPDLFDMYSVGIIFLQMASPNLRTPVGVQSLKQELSDANHDLNAWRRKTRLRPNLEVLELGGGQGWNLATKLVCERRKRLSAAAAMRHPYFLLG